MWIVLVLAVLVVLAAVALSVTRSRTHTAEPLVTVGLGIAGTSAVLIATLGPAMVATLLVGLACIAIGARRSRRS